MNRISAPSCADPFEPNMISLGEAIARIEERVKPVTESESLPLRDCLDRVNHDSIFSPINVPPHANSAMDGVAVAIESLKPSGISLLDDVGTAFAGTPFTEPCLPGQCVRIMTGALIPAGTNAVIMQEQTERDSDGKVRVDHQHRIDENIRQAGEDIGKGDQVIEAGARLNPADIGVLASLGIARLKVKRKPRVAFFSTGDELIAIDQPLRAGKIYDSNRYTLHALLSRLSVEIVDLGVIPDQPDAIRQALTDAAQQADLVISTGGVSMGEADYIKPALEAIGSSEFWKIAIKPGRPLTLGQIDGSTFMGLPGNPVAVMVTFSQFVLPAIHALAGSRPKRPILLNATATDRIRKRPGRYEFQRGIASLDANNQWQVGKTGKQGSGILTSMSRANCFIVLPDENAGVEAGDPVSIQLFDWNF